MGGVGFGSGKSACDWHELNQRRRDLIQYSEQVANRAASSWTRYKGSGFLGSIRHNCLLRLRRVEDVYREIDYNART